MHLGRSSRPRRPASSSAAACAQARDPRALRPPRLLLGATVGLPPPPGRCPRTPVRGGGTRGSAGRRDDGSMIDRHLLRSWDEVSCSRSQHLWHSTSTRWQIIELLGCAGSARYRAGLLARSARIARARLATRSTRGNRCAAPRGPKWTGTKRSPCHDRKAYSGDSSAAWK